MNQMRPMLCKTGDNRFIEYIAQDQNFSHIFFFICKKRLINCLVDCMVFNAVSIEFQLYGGGEPCARIHAILEDLAVGKKKTSLHQYLVHFFNQWVLWIRIYVTMCSEQSITDIPERLSDKRESYFSGHLNLCQLTKF